MTEVNAVGELRNDVQVVDFRSRDRLGLADLGHDAALWHAVVQEKGVISLNAREVTRLYPQVLDHETKLSRLSQLVVRRVGVLGQVHQQVVVMNELGALQVPRELLRRQLVHPTPHLPHCRLVTYKHHQVALLRVFFN